MKTLVFLSSFLISVSLSAQNIQLHYDFGKDRKFFTATLEMFKPDTLGSTFWFVDLDYSSNFDFDGEFRSMSAAYWEISREFYIPGIKKIKGIEQLAFHIEYNDGFGAGRDTASNIMTAFTFNSVFLTGFSYPIRIGNTVFATMLLCRLPRGLDDPDFQFTTTWFQPVWKNRILLTGFIDVWSQDKIGNRDEKEIVFQSEPQIWFMITPKIAVGGEVEIDKNFPVGPADWQFIPTLGLRWEF
ncbi:MAG: hypothetical protein A2Y87_10365 [Bacteroidetes bacterium RBG_13_46_8]|nr:MAG: hypothetical protein A2Y87_10365 [Bacteroidetes bacterium RBG_13_46_8]